MGRVRGGWRSAAPLVAVALLAGLGSGRARASAEAVDPGRALIDATHRLDRGERAWRTRSERLSIRIENARGGVIERELVMRTGRGEPGEDRTFTVFLAPAEVRGTAFLQLAHKDRDADQWLFLPELHRVRRISGASRRQSFVGTHFSYRDLELLDDVLEWSDEEAPARRLGPGKIEDLAVTRIELRPEVKDVGYDRIVVSISEADHVLRGLDLFEGGDRPRKVLRLLDVRWVDGKPTAHRLEMTDRKRGGRTVVEVSEVRYDEDLPEGIFTRRALEHALDYLDE